MSDRGSDSPVPRGVLLPSDTDSVVDRILTGISLAGISIADFWLGMMLILVFAVHLQWLPTSGFDGYTGLST